MLRETFNKHLFIGVREIINQMISTAITLYNKLLFRVLLPFCRTIVRMYYLRKRRLWFWSCWFVCTFVCLSFVCQHVYLQSNKWICTRLIPEIFLGPRNNRLNAMQCNAMQCNAMQRNAMQCNAMQCNAMQCNAMQCNTMQCNEMQCNAKQCDAMKCNAKQCNAMQCDGE